MIYARVEDSVVVEYPLYQGEIRARFPNSSFPIPFSPPDGYELVADAAPPLVDHTEKIEEGQPRLVNGVWTRTWLTKPASQIEIDSRLEAKAQAVRAERDRRLRDSDWTQFSDAVVDAVSWAAYRQALRDVPSQPGFPMQTSWPEPPSASASIPNWRGFLVDLRLNSVFSVLRELAKSDARAGATIAEFRVSLWEAVLGLAEPVVIQDLVDELLPLLPAVEIAKISSAITKNHIPLVVAL